MPFDLPSSFVTGLDELDSQHRALVARVNSIESAESERDKGKLLGALAEFMADLAEHFQWEEECMKQSNYPNCIGHANQHTETIAALDRLIHDIDEGVPLSSSAAHICFHELVSAMLKVDLEFTNWLSAKPGSATKTR